MRAASAALLAAALCVSMSAAAQSYAGTYTARNPEGATVTGATITLTLRQDVQGAVAGTFSVDGAALAVHGEVTEDGLLGMVVGEGTRLYILARHEAGRLVVVLAEPNAVGLPNLQAARELVFTPRR